jgi:hypothetical protein
MTAKSQLSSADPAAQHHLEAFLLEPAIKLRNGRIIRNAAEAVDLVREHEARPGVDDRDEVLHQLERARTDSEKAAAVNRFRRWLMDWGVTLPVASDPRSTRGQKLPPTDL